MKSIFIIFLALLLLEKSYAQDYSALKSWVDQFQSTGQNSPESHIESLKVIIQDLSNLSWLKRPSKKSFQQLNDLHDMIIVYNQSLQAKGQAPKINSTSTQPSMQLDTLTTGPLDIKKRELSTAEKSKVELTLMKLSEVEIAEITQLTNQNMLLTTKAHNLLLKRLSVIEKSIIEMRDRLSSNSQQISGELSFLIEQNFQQELRRQWLNILLKINELERVF